MLSSVLKSERAEKVNLLIIDTFVELNQMFLTHKDLLLKIEEMEKKGVERDNQIMLIFEYIKQFEEVKQEELEHRNREKIGFKQQNKDVE